MIIRPLPMDAYGRPVPAAAANTGRHQENSADIILPIIEAALAAHSIGPEGGHQMAPVPSSDQNLVAAFANLNATKNRAISPGLQAAMNRYNITPVTHSPGQMRYAPNIGQPGENVNVGGAGNLAVNQPPVESPLQGAPELFNPASGPTLQGAPVIAPPPEENSGTSLVTPTPGAGPSANSLLNRGIPGYAAGIHPQVMAAAAQRMLAAR